MIVSQFFLNHRDTMTPSDTENIHCVPLCLCVSVVQKKEDAFNCILLKN